MGLLVQFQVTFSEKIAITTVPFKALSDQVWIRYLLFLFL